MKNKKLQWSALLFIIPFAMGLYYYDDLPQQVAIHFDSSNAADGFADKTFAIFGLPAGMLVLHFIIIFFLKKDPKRKNMPSIMMNIMYIFIPLLTILVMGITIFYSLGTKVNIGIVISIPIGILFLILGNYLPKVKQNYSMGIKTPWTLNNEEVWNKTHRLGGFCFIVMGLGTIISGFTSNSLSMLFFVIPCAIIPMAYSYFLYQKIEKNNK